MHDTKFQVFIISFEMCYLILYVPLFLIALISLRTSVLDIVLYVKLVKKSNIIIVRFLENGW